MLLSADHCRRPDPSARPPSTTTTKDLSSSPEPKPGLKEKMVAESRPASPARPAQNQRGGSVPPGRPVTKSAQKSRKVMAAGCAGYMVSFLGKRVLYFGRTAETHVEHFPR